MADLVLHDAIPFLYPLYWLVFLPKGSLRWSEPAWWLVFPALYFLYSMLRGAAFGTYLYPHSPDDAIICSVDAAIQLT